MIRSLDKYLQGAIDWKIIATYIILLNSEIMNEKQLEAYKNEMRVKDDWVSERNFLSVI